jgi:hypothetical protein
MPIAGDTVPGRQAFKATHTVEALMHEPGVRRFLEEHFA